MNRDSLRRLVAVAVALAACGAAPARADLAPPSEFERACTVKRAGESCRSCAADFLDAAACARTLGPQGFARRCRAPGLTSWTEVWCPAPAVAASASAATATAPASASAVAPTAPAPSATSAAPRSGCAVSAGEIAETGAAMVGLALCAMAWVARRLRDNRTRSR